MKPLICGARSAEVNDSEVTDPICCENVKEEMSSPFIAVS